MREILTAGNRRQHERTPADEASVRAVKLLFDQSQEAIHTRHMRHGLLVATRRQLEDHYPRFFGADEEKAADLTIIGNACKCADEIQNAQTPEQVIHSYVQFQKSLPADHESKVSRGSESTVKQMAMDKTFALNFVLFSPKEEEEKKEDGEEVGQKRARTE